MRCLGHATVALALAGAPLLAGPALAEKLDLTGYKLTFDDEFNGLSVSQGGVGTTWADIRAQNRFDSNSDIGFGKSSFLDAASGYNPFSVSGGALTIAGIPYTVRFGYPGSWQSALLHTRQSFAQAYGYFEMRARFNSVPGTWPAFWLLPVTPLNPSGRDPSLWQELDVVEQYGAYPQGVYSNIHTTQPAPAGVTWDFFSSHPEIASGYHTYGMDWEPTSIKWYVDGILMGTKPTPDDMAGPMYLLVDLARDTPYAGNAPAMSMNVDYIRAFSKDPVAIPAKRGGVSAPDGNDPGLYGATAAPTAPPDRLKLAAYEQAYKGDCEFTVSLDGVELGGVQTVTGTQTSPQAFTFSVNLPKGSHTVGVNFLNAVNEGVGKQRALYLNGVMLSGVLRFGASIQVSGGDHKFSVKVP